MRDKLFRILKAFVAWCAYCSVALLFVGILLFAAGRQGSASAFRYVGF